MLKSSTIRFSADTFGKEVPFVDEPIEPTPEDPDAPDEKQPDPEDEQPIPVIVKQALLVSKVPLDCTKKTAIDQFIITGAEPEGSKRRVIFKIDDALYKFKNGSLIAYPYDGNVDDILNYGNKASNLATYTNLDLSAFVGKKVYPIIALQSPADADEYPTIKLALATRTNTEQLVNTVDSPIYELDDEPQTITDITAKTKCIGYGDVDITVRLRTGSDWSSYMALADAADNQADAVQFKIKYTVTTADGSDSAQVQSIIISHASGATVVTGNNANLFSTVEQYDNDLQTAYVVVRHAPLVDATIEAYVNFMAPPKHRNLLQIGTATGSRQELTLGNPDSNIVASSIKLYQDDEPFYDFDFSTELGTVILTAKKNSVITASYDYDYGVEEWRQMTPEDPQPYNDDVGSLATRFTYSLTEEESVGMQIANVRIRLRRKSGSNAGTVTKSATGKTQLFTFSHKARPSSIQFDTDVNYTYDENSGILSCVAAKGTRIYVTYDWVGEAPVVYSFAAGYSVA